MLVSRIPFTSFAQSPAIAIIDGIHTEQKCHHLQQKRQIYSHGR
jgi:hypothetical protein